MRFPDSRSLVVIGLITSSFPLSAQVSRDGFVRVEPCRVYDSRVTDGAPNPLIAGQARTIDMSRCVQIVPGITAYALNFTVTGSAAGSTYNFLTAYPTGTSRPFTSTVNFLSGAQIANSGIIAAGQSGNIDVYSSRTTHLIVDVTGIFMPVVASVSAGAGVAVTQSDSTVTVGADFGGNGSSSKVSRSDHTHERNMVVVHAGPSDDLANGAALVEAAQLGVPLIELEPGDYVIPPTANPQFPNVEGSVSLDGATATRIYYSGNQLVGFRSLKNAWLFVTASGSTGPNFTAVSLEAADDVFCRVDASGSGTTLTGFAVAPSGKLRHATLSVDTTAGTYANVTALDARYSQYVSEVDVNLVAGAGATEARAIHSDTVNGKFTNVSATVSGAATNYAFHVSSGNMSGESINAEHLHLVAKGAGAASYGFYSAIRTTLNDVDVNVDAGSAAGYGLIQAGGSEESSFRSINSTIVGNGSGNFAFKAENSPVELRDADLKSAAGTAVVIAGTPKVNVAASVLRAPAAIAIGAGGNATVAATRVAGTVSNAGSLQCVYAYSDAMTALDAACE